MVNAQLQGNSCKKSRNTYLTEITERLERWYCQVSEKKEAEKKRAFHKRAINFYDSLVKKYREFKKNSFVIGFLCSSEIIAALFVFMSSVWTAVGNLACYGMSRPLYLLFLCGVLLMQLAVLSFIAAKALGKTEVKDKNGIDYQKMRLIEIKLFRSPYMPDSKNEKQEIRRSEIYMGYYTIEKRINEQIKRACSDPGSIDRQVILSEYAYTELKAQALFVLSGKSDCEEVSIKAAIARRALLYRAYHDLYDRIVQEGSSLASDLYELTSNEEIEGFRSKVLESVQAQKRGRVEACACYIVASCVHRFAGFAKSYIDNLESNLSKECDPSSDKKHKGPTLRRVWSALCCSMMKVDSSRENWSSLKDAEKDELKRKAFQWALEQHIKRHCKKLSNTYHEGWWRKMSVDILCFLIAVFPSGLSILALSPVSVMVSMVGMQMKGAICLMFCIFAGVNYVVHNRKEMHKVWQNLCAFAAKYSRGVLAGPGLVEGHTWEVRYDHIWRGVMAMMMAFAQAIFAYVTAESFILNPAKVGAEQIHSALFTLAPWLAPYFTYLCCVLTFLGTCLGCLYTTKYLSIGHSPAAKKDPIGRSLVHYFIMHNFDFSKRPAYKGLKLLVTGASVAQTMVIFVSNRGILGFLPALVLMPAVFLTYAVIFRKLVDMVFDWRYKVRCEEVSPVLVIKDVCSNQVNVESLASALDEKWKLGKRSLHFNHDVRPRVDEHKVKKVKRAFFDKLLGVQRKVEFEETQGIPRVPSRTSIITDSTQSAEVSPVVEGQALEQQRFDQNMKRVGSLSEMLNTKRAEMTRQKLLDTEQDLMGGEDAFAVAKQEILSQGASTSLAQGPEEHRGVYGKSAFLNQ